MRKIYIHFSPAHNGWVCSLKFAGCDHSIGNNQASQADLLAKVRGLYSGDLVVCFPGKEEVELNT